MAADTNGARLLSRQLAGYLCGTHSGVLGLSNHGRRLGRLDLENITALHRTLDLPVATTETELGAVKWEPQEQSRLADHLRAALGSPDVIELVFFGSQAGGDRTGFSDVDAILVISDDAADSPTRLRRLRPYVLAAQCAVLSYQPLQHHGFEVATPRLLRQGDHAVGLPAAALANTRSLRGNSITAGLAGLRTGKPKLERMAKQLGQLRNWPTHRWCAYLNLAMFELLPALYLQARGQPISKAASFAAARGDFSETWWPFDTLADVRRNWPILRCRNLDAAAALVRNPWVAVAAWRRIPAAVPSAVRSVLTPELLAGLQSVADAMVRQSP